MQLIFELETLSDFHIGSGSSKCGIDSLFLKDHNNLPTIRGSTLKGLLRKALTELLTLIPKKKNFKENNHTTKGNYCLDELCPICRILGTPATINSWRISSAIIKNPKLATNKIVTRNRINLKTRKTEARKLFNEENYPKGLKFQFIVSIDGDSIKTLEDAALITAAYRMVRSLGSSQRRGKGSCQIHLKKVDTNLNFPETDKKTAETFLLDVFQHCWLKNKALKQIGVNKPSTFVLPKKNYFKIVLLTMEPIIISKKHEMGNNFITQNYIPGTTLLGAMAWKVVRNNDLKKQSIYTKFIELFKKGGIKVSPLYPAYSSPTNPSILYPTIPAPLSLLNCKLYPKTEPSFHEAINFALKDTEPTICEECFKKGEFTPLVPLDVFLAVKKPIEGKPFESVKLQTNEEIHITIDLKTGKTKTGDLFSYHSINSNKAFIGTMEISDCDSFAKLIKLNKLKNGFSFELFIGKATSRGYGKVKVFLYDKDSPIDVFIKKPISERIQTTDQIIMTLLSDTILVDDWLRFQTTLDEKVLSKLLGFKVEIINSFTKSGYIDGFNSLFGLPKWRDKALIAGSTVGFRVKEEIPQNELIDTLQKLEEEGIGLRTSEGFGRVAFNHPIFNSIDEGIGELFQENQETHFTLFERSWKRELETLSNSKLKFKDSFWMLIARWFYKNTNRDLDSLITALKTFNFEEEIKKLIEAKITTPRKEALDTKYKDGSEILIEWLNKLKNILTNHFEEEEVFKVKGLKMLAETITNICQKEEEEE